MLSRSSVRRGPTSVSIHGGAQGWPKTAIPRAGAHFAPVDVTGDVPSPSESAGGPFNLGLLGPEHFDTCPEFWDGVTSETPAPQPCRQCPDQPLRSGTAGRMANRTSAQRAAAVGRS